MWDHPHTPRGEAPRPCVSRDLEPSVSHCREGETIGAARRHEHELGRAGTPRQARAPPPTPSRGPMRRPPDINQDPSPHTHNIFDISGCRRHPSTGRLPLADAAPAHRGGAYSSPEARYRCIAGRVKGPPSARTSSTGNVGGAGGEGDSCDVSEVRREGDLLQPPVLDWRCPDGIVPVPRVRSQVQLAGAEVTEVRSRWCRWCSATRSLRTCSSCDCEVCPVHRVYMNGVAVCFACAPSDEPPRHDDAVEPPDCPACQEPDRADREADDAPSR
jgi:hypothetical protein